MINWQAVRRGIYKWATDESKKALGNNVGIEFIWENQSESKVPSPYGTLNFSTGPLRKFHDEQRKQGEDVFLSSGLREITLSVNLYGEKAFEVAEYLAGGIQKETVTMFLGSIGLACIESSAPRNLSRLISTRHESRFQFDLRLRIASNIVDVDSFFESVEISDEIVKPKLNLIP